MNIENIKDNRIKLNLHFREEEIEALHKVIDTLSDFIDHLSEDNIELMVCTDIDTSITIDDLDYLLDKLNEYELFITEKNYYGKIGSEG